MKRSNAKKRKTAPEHQVRRRRKVLSKRIARALNRDLFEGAFGATLESPAPPALTDSSAGARSSVAVEELRSANLPTLPELYRLYDMYNLVHFDGKLPRVKLTYSTRMLAAGSCAPREREIRIGLKYHQLFPQDLDDTLIHEMIHLIYPSHNSDFKKVANRLGVSVYARSHPDLRRPPKYIYYCPSCGQEYPRQKRLRMTSCGRCSGSKFDIRFKLRLQRKPS